MENEEMLSQATCTIVFKTPDGYVITVPTGKTASMKGTIGLYSNEFVDLTMCEVVGVQWVPVEPEPIKKNMD